LARAGHQPRANNIIFRSADGYSTSLRLDYIKKSDALLGYRINGLALDAKRGYPFQVVAEHQLGYKWAKWVVEIEASDQPFKGYWEQRGYPEDAHTDR
jgi:DMSO/TMAO reductase YedYZ molybdopterin-dependent catalytic subunit